MQQVPDPALDGAAGAADDPFVFDRVLLQALESIRGEFHERTWQAFWGVVVEGRTAADVAAASAHETRRRPRGQIARPHAPPPRAGRSTHVAPRRTSPPFPSKTMPRSLLALTLAGFALTPAAAQQPGEKLFIATPLTKAGEFTEGIEGPACDAAGNIYAVNFARQQTIGKRHARRQGRGLRHAARQELRATASSSTATALMYVADYVGHNVLRIDPADAGDHRLRPRAEDEPAERPGASRPTARSTPAIPTGATSTGQLWRIDREGKRDARRGRDGHDQRHRRQPRRQDALRQRERAAQRLGVRHRRGRRLRKKRLLQEVRRPRLRRHALRRGRQPYITRYGKGTVAVVSPQGEVLREIDVLGAKPSNLCFGGPDGRTVYVTEVEAHAARPVPRGPARLGMATLAERVMLRVRHDSSGAFALRARWVFPVATAPLSGGAVTVRNGRVAAVGAGPADAPVTDLGDAAILPGLVNAHTHLEFSELSSPLGEPGMPFAHWLREVIAYRTARNEATAAGRSQPEASILQGLRKSAACGVTALGEIASPGWPQAPFESTDVAAVVFQELLGLAPQRQAPLLELAASHVAAGQGSGRWRPGLSPHAPHRAAGAGGSRRRTIAARTCSAGHAPGGVVGGNRTIAVALRSAARLPGRTPRRNCRVTFRAACGRSTISNAWRAPIALWRFTATTSTTKRSTSWPRGRIAWRSCFARARTTTFATAGIRWKRCCIAACASRWGPTRGLPTPI